MFVLPTGWALVDGAAAEGFEGGPHPPTYSCAVPRGWRAAVRGNIRVVKSGNLAWGGLHSPAPGSYFVVLQGAYRGAKPDPAWIEQELTGLSPAHEYAVSFLAAYRPDPYKQAVLRLVVDGKETSGPIDLAPKFTRRQYTFVASTSTATIRFSNRGTTAGDRSAFIDAVTIKATGRHGRKGTVCSSVLMLLGLRATTPKHEMACPCKCARVGRA